MNIGFVNIYSFRPHVEHLYYLSLLMKNAGHEIHFLTCDADVKSCYPRLLKGTSKFVECSKCIVGGVRSYPVNSVTSISSGTAHLEIDTLEQIALSSSCTLNRTESEHEWNESEVVAVRKKLYDPIASVHLSAMKWIDSNNLDAVICFNGRMDLTRSVTFACEQKNIPFITHERTWFGDGLQLIPNENCLSLKALDDMVQQFDDKPLTFSQAQLAGKLAAERFLQSNTLEWRLYNKNPEPAPWPLQSKGKRVLVLPSSKNEFAGHAEWQTGWLDNTSALDEFFAAFRIKPEDVVIRFHPNWAEKIGSISGQRATKHYTDWSTESGIHFITSEDKANTYDLIQQADIVVLNGGSSAVEAGICGKQVICLGPSSYEKAGFLRVFNNKEDMYRTNALVDIEPEIVIKKTLRYIYLRARRFPQFVNFVKAIKTTKYQYFQGANPQRIIDMITTGKVSPDDEIVAENESEELSIVSLIKDRDWQTLANHEPSIYTKKSVLSVKRRFTLRWLDSFRRKFALGDR